MRRVIRHRPSPAMVLAMIALIVALGGSAFAALRGVPDRKGVFHGCVNNSSGELRVVKRAASCRGVKKRNGKIVFPGETAIAWNQKGRPGTNGTDGTNGINGTNGTNGINGTNGTQRDRRDRRRQRRARGELPRWPVHILRSRRKQLLGAERNVDRLQHPIGGRHGVSRPNDRGARSLRPSRSCQLQRHPDLYAGGQWRGFRPPMHHEPRRHGHNVLGYHSRRHDPGGQHDRDTSNPVGGSGGVNNQNPYRFGWRATTP